MDNGLYILATRQSGAKENQSILVVSTRKK